MKKYDLIIFDCDGTLVDSEYLNNKVSSDGLIALGLSEYTPERCITEFAGVSWTEIKSILETRHNIEIPRYVIDDYIRNVQEQMETYMKQIDGALDFVRIANNKAKICVGSNGMRVNVLQSLQLSGMMDYFTEDQVFTKIQVKNPKPAPDLFLLAAETMGIVADKCLVIEDSPTGVAAGVAAGMDVWGFVGTSHEPELQRKKLIDRGAGEVFDRFIHIQERLGY